ncbi:hypothetical protein ACFL34_03265 [Candidatus Sumerlaeota bacterium]
MNSPRNCALGAMLIGLLLLCKVVAEPPGPAYEGPSEYPVAPKIPPITPETRTLISAEAAALLKDDWLFQADHAPNVERVAREIAWTRDLAARLAKNPATPDLSGDLASIRALEDRLAADNSRETYLALRAVKRRIMFKNPVLDFSQVLFIDNPYPQGQEWKHQSRQRNGFMAVPGGRLLLLDGLHPGGEVRQLAPAEPGAFWRPELSFDAKKVLFCFKPHDEKAYHVYEMNIDGTGLRQLTFGNYDDMDPIYLPDGHIVFSSARCNTYVRCFPCSPAYVLCRADADGKNIYILSQGNEPEWLPSLLHDGRIVYSRWEYTDKALWRVQSLWTMNPDGTGAAAFWGNQSVWPDHTAEPRAIPGSRRVMFTGLGHHDWFAGCIGIVDPARGINFPNGLTKVTSDLVWPEVGNGPVDPHETTSHHASGRYNAYKTPYPLSQEDFLVSARRDDKYRLYLMDLQGNRELIYQGAHHIWHAIPLKPRRRPPVIADTVAWPGTGKDRKPNEPGALFSSNVYEGVPDLPPGKAKYLRVIQMDAKTYSTWRKSYRHSGPAISIIQEGGVKRFLGTVPIESDGSVNFKVPAGVALHFQLLDEDYKALQTMRSFTGVMPGESRGCVGCHEATSVSTPNRSGIATRRPPVELTPPPWGTVTIGYERFAQPVLDKYCGKCHQGEGKARKKLDLTLRSATALFNGDGNLRGGPSPFKEPYLTLVGPAWTSPIRDRSLPGVGIAGCFNVEGYKPNDPNSLATIRPMTTLSCTSKLIEIASSGKHHDVKVAPADLRRLIAWVDSNCVYRGDPEVREIPDPTIPGIEHLPIRPRVKTAPIITRP